MKKTMIGYRGIDFVHDLVFCVEPSDLGYKIIRDGKEFDRDMEGEIYFQNDSGTCLVNINGTVYKGKYILDKKLLTINVPGFTEGKVELGQFKFKR